MTESSFRSTAAPNTSKYKPENASAVYSHTADEMMAKRVVRGYFGLMRMLGVHIPTERECLDVGCGVGHITAEFQRAGLKMVGIEFDDVAVEAAKRHNPDVCFAKGDMTTLHEPGKYGFIFCREVYLMTRVNAFTDQHAVISRLVDSLCPGGLLMLIGSDASRPHCADYGLLIKTFRKDDRLRYVSGRYSEQLLAHFQPLLRFRPIYSMIRAVLSPALLYKRHCKGWAEKNVIIFGRA